MGTLDKTKVAELVVTSSQGDTVSRTVGFHEEGDTLVDGGGDIL